jgi:hypothetical protein
MSDQTPLHDPLTDAFDSFRGDALPTFTPPGADAVRTTVRRRQRNRSVAIAACAVVALVGTGVALANLRPPADGLEPAPAPSVTDTPTPTATPTTSATPSTIPSAGTGALDLTKVDWRNHSVPIPASTGCPAGDVRFQDGAATIDGYEYALLRLDGLRTAYGDVDRDGRPEAVLHLSCGNGGDGKEHLIVIAAHTNQLRAIGSTGTEERAAFTAYQVQGGEIVATVREGGTNAARSQTRRYKWDGAKIVQVGGPSRFEGRSAQVDTSTYDWSTATLTIPFQRASAAIEPNNRSCPRVTVTFSHVHENEGTVQSGPCEYWLKRIGTSDLNGDGTTDALVRISAIVAGTGDLTTGASWYFGYTIRDGKPALLGFVTAANLDNRDDNAPEDVTATTAKAGAAKVTVAQVFRSTGKPNQTLTRTFTWTGSGFAPSQTAPNPRADSQP